MLLLLLGSTVLFGLHSGCGSDPGERRLDEIPRLFEDVRPLLDIEEDTPRRDAFRQVGVTRVYTTWQAFDEYLGALPASELEAAREELRPYTHRLMRSMDEAFDYPAATWWSHYMDTLSAESAGAREWARKARLRITYDESQSVSAIYDSLVAVRDVWSSVGDSANVALAESGIAYKALDVDRELGWGHVWRALRAAEQVGHREVELQMIGLLAFLHSAEGRPDSSRYWLEEGLERAVHAHHGPQAARFSNFLANWYESRGRFAVSDELRDQTLVHCKELVAGPAEVRYLTEAMRHWGRRGCWEAVERLLPRARLARRESLARSREGVDTHGLEIDALEANLELARGQIAEAEALTASMVEREATYSHADPRKHDLIRAEIGDLLLALDRPEPVAAHLDSVLQNQDVTNNIIVARRLGLQWARARLALGDPNGCLQALAQREDWIQPRNGTDPTSAELEIRALVELDSLDAARQRLRHTLEETIRHFSRAEPSPQAYLELNEAGSIYALAQKLWGDSEEEDYRLGIAWEGLAGQIGHSHEEIEGSGHTPVGQPIDQPVDQRVDQPPTRLRELGEEATEVIDRWIDRTDGVHILFELRGESFLRSTHTREGVSRDTLEVSVDDLRSTVARLLRVLATDAESSATPGPELREALRGLADVLVPTTLREFENVAWSVPDFLRFLPPGILDLGRENDYDPWVLHANIAVLRPVGSTELPNATGSGLILVDPDVTPELRRRFPEIVDLTFAEGEARAAIASGVPFEVLRGPEATKAALFANWERAPYVHLATHLVRRPENPYVTFVPLAGSGGAARDDALLEIVDVRRADLRACRTVVLSGCDTGAPASVRDGADAPTLAEAFLDSGARSVVQTAWRVRDDAAADLVAGFIAKRLTEGEHSVEALAGAQRANAESAHPYHWGAFVVQLGLGGLEDW